jgi:hypothetical protein
MTGPALEARPAAPIHTAIIRHHLIELALDFLRAPAESVVLRADRRRARHARGRDGRSAEPLTRLRITHAASAA